MPWDRKSHDRPSSSNRDRPRNANSHSLEFLEIPLQKGRMWCSLFPKIPLQYRCAQGDRRSQDFKDRCQEYCKKVITAFLKHPAPLQWLIESKRTRARDLIQYDHQLRDHREYHRPRAFRLDGDGLREGGNGELG